MNTMNNTHYNIIDTLLFAFGEDIMKDIGKKFAFLVNASGSVPVSERREYIMSEIQLLVPALEKSNYAVRYTLLDCFLFGATEGLVGNYIYGFGHHSVKTEELQTLIQLNKQ